MSEIEASSDTGGPYQIKLKGLPYEVTNDDILQFLSDCMIVEQGIQTLLNESGRPSGEALVVLESHEDVVKALDHNRQHMGSRYIEIMEITQQQYQDDMNQQPASEPGSDLIVRLRGLPYSAQVKDILTLLSDCQVKDEAKGVKFTFDVEGRPSGEAFVELCSAEDVEKALAHSHEHMGRRYVEIFRANRSQMEWDCRKEDKIGGEGSGVVRLRGLPFGCTIEQIENFFSGINVVHGGITIQKEIDGRETGEAFVELVSKDDVDKALARDRKEIQHRYIEVFRSSHSEVKPYKGGRPTPYSRPGGRGGGYQGYGTYGGGGAKYGSGYERNYRGGRGRGVGRGGGYGYGGDGGYYEDPGYFHGPPHHGPPHHGPPPHGPPPHGEDPNLVAYPPIRQSQNSRGGYGGPPNNGAGYSGPPVSQHSVRMRGLPYSVKEKDITDFFSPLTTLRVSLEFDQYGRPSGEAEVYFSTHEDANAAMQKNNQHIGHRYIELFLNSSRDSAPSHGGGQYGHPPQGNWNNAPAPAVAPPPQQQHQYQYQQNAGYAPSGVGYQPAATAYQPAGTGYYS